MYEKEKKMSQNNFEIIIERRNQFCAMIGQNIAKLFKFKLPLLLDLEVNVPKPIIPSDINAFNDHVYTLIDTLKLTTGNIGIMYANSNKVCMNDMFTLKCEFKYVNSFMNNVFNEKDKGEIDKDKGGRGDMYQGDLEQGVAGDNECVRKISNSDQLRGSEKVYINIKKPNSGSKNNINRS